MGCCISKKSTPSPPLLSLSDGVKASDPIKPMKQVIQPIEEVKPKSEESHQEDDTTKEALVIKHKKNNEGSKKTDSEESSTSMAAEKSNDLAVASIVSVSSCSKEEVDAILIQCGKLSRNNSAAKTRRYSGSKRSFDFDQNERIHGGDVEDEHGGEEHTHRSRHRGERRRRTPSREREDSGKSYRSGSRERGNGGGGRRVSRSPGKRSEPNLNPNSTNNRHGKFVTVPATDKSNNGESLNKRVTVKRNIGEACRTAASPARAAQSPYRRNPLGEIDQNSTKGDKIGSTKPNHIRAASPVKRSRSLRKSRDFDFKPETLQSNEDNNYTALLLKDIQNFHFHGKTFNNVDYDVSGSFEAVAALSSDSNQFRFTSTAADLMEPSFEKYVTLKR